MNGDEERAWRHRVDEHLVVLTTAQKVTNDHLDQIDETLDALDRTIRGDYEKDRDGIVARMENMERSVALLHSVLFKDSTGKKGLVDTVDVLISGKIERREKRKDYITIAIAIISTIGLIITNLDRIESFWVHIFIKTKPPVVVKHRRHIISGESSESE